jgi:hypothetical protein
MTKEGSIIKKHIKGWITIIVILIMQAITTNLYELFRSPVEAQVAAKQAEDSIAWWGLYHSMAYGNLVPNIIMTIAIILIILILIPTLKDLYKIVKTNACEGDSKG